MFIWKMVLSTLKQINKKEVTETLLTVITDAGYAFPSSAK